MNNKELQPSRTLNGNDLTTISNFNLPKNGVLLASQSSNSAMAMSSQSKSNSQFRVSLANKPRTNAFSSGFSQGIITAGKRSLRSLSRASG